MAHVRDMLGVNPAKFGFRSRKALRCMWERWSLSAEMRAAASRGEARRRQSAVLRIRVVEHPGTLLSGQEALRTHAGAERSEWKMFAIETAVQSGVERERELEQPALVPRWSADGTHAACAEWKWTVDNGRCCWYETAVESGVEREREFWTLRRKVRTDFFGVVGWLELVGFEVTVETKRTNGAGFPDASDEWGAAEISC
ncbi:hypothetical protein B0H19DRAFT_1056976 [Mycena capillaripes]|nr:hypothetical protein B0H19DRAFT_1056976 [Mycena capillaripes]